MVPFSGVAGETHMMHAIVAVSVPADAAAGPRYINKLGCHQALPVLDQLNI
jgi:hypothetical protein